MRFTTWFSTVFVVFFFLTGCEAAKEALDTAKNAASDEQTQEAPTTVASDEKSQENITTATRQFDDSKRTPKVAKSQFPFDGIYTISGEVMVRPEGNPGTNQPQYNAFTWHIKGGRLVAHIPTITDDTVLNQHTVEYIPSGGILVKEEKNRDKDEVPTDDFIFHVKHVVRDSEKNTVNLQVDVLTFKGTFTDNRVRDQYGLTRDVNGKITGTIQITGKTDDIILWTAVRPHNISQLKKDFTGTLVSGYHDGKYILHHLSAQKKSELDGVFLWEIAHDELVGFQEGTIVNSNVVLRNSYTNNPPPMIGKHGKLRYDGSFSFLVKVFDLSTTLSGAQFVTANIPRPSRDIYMEGKIVEAPPGTLSLENGKYSKFHAEKEVDTGTFNKIEED